MRACLICDRVVVLNDPPDWCHIAELSAKTGIARGKLMVDLQTFEVRPGKYMCSSYISSLTIKPYSKPTFQIPTVSPIEASMERPSAL